MVVDMATSEEVERGRKQGREANDTLDGNDEEGTQTGGQRKRKRSRKALDKKFQCPEQGCGKSYSRAEHLYRHQLNREFYETTLPHIRMN